MHGVSLLHGLQRGACLLAGLGLRAEEHQILQQSRGRQTVATGHGGVLHEHARSHALDVKVCGNQPTREAIKKRRSNLPEAAGRHVLGLTCRKAQAQHAHLRRCLAVIALYHAQHHTIQHGAGFRAIGQRLGHGPGPARLAGPALRWPQVCGVHLVIAGQCLGIAVLGKQSHRRHALARQHGFQIFHQRKVRALKGRCGFLGAVFRALHKTVNGSFHASQHLRRAADAHHFQRTTGLMQLLACNAQRRCVQRFQIRLAGCIRIPNKTAYGLGRCLQRLAHFIEHPGQRAQILLVGPSCCCTCWRVVNL